MNEEIRKLGPMKLLNRLQLRRGGVLLEMDRIEKTHSVTVIILQKRPECNIGILNDTILQRHRKAIVCKGIKQRQRQIEL